MANAATSRSLNAMAVDPTGTSGIVRRCIADMTRRLGRLRSAIWQLVAVQDAFGLDVTGPGMDRLLGNADTSGPIGTPVPPTFRFETDPGKVTAFQAWLKQQVADGVLEVVPSPNDLPGAGKDAPWLSAYIKPTYKKGLLDAYGAAPTPVNGYKKDRAQFLQDAFDSPVAVGKLELIYSRNYAALKGMTDTMDGQLSRILADALAQGKSSQATAKAMVDQVDGMTKRRAKTIARTELIHAHAEGTLDGYENLGIDSVSVMVEWTTAKDGRVCPLCKPLNGVVLTLKEARGMIPRHPNCRCAWRPAVPDHNIFLGKDSKWGKEALDYSLKESLLAGAKKGATLQEARAGSTWVGSLLKPADKAKLKPTVARVSQLKADLTAQVAAKKAAKKLAEELAAQKAAEEAAEEAAALKAAQEAEAKAAAEALAKKQAEEAALAKKLLEEELAKKAAAKAALEAKLLAEAKAKEAAILEANKQAAIAKAKQIAEELAAKKAQEAAALALKLAAEAAEKKLIEEALAKKAAEAAAHSAKIKEGMAKAHLVKKYGLTDEDFKGGKLTGTALGKITLAKGWQGPDWVTDNIGDAVKIFDAPDLATQKDLIAKIKKPPKGKYPPAPPPAPAGAVPEPPVAPPVPVPETPAPVGMTTADLAKLKKIKDLPGSTSPDLMEAPDGQRWVMKSN